MQAPAKRPVSFAPKRIAPTIKEQEAKAALRPVSDVVIIRRREDGTYFEKPGAPSFMRKRGIGTGEPKLPEDYYIRGSKAHLARRADVGLD